MSEGGHEDAFIGQNEGEFEDGTVLEDLNENDRGAEDEGDDESMDGGGSDDAADGQGRPNASDPDDVHTFLGHNDGVYSVAWHPTLPDVVASGGADDKAFIWRVGQDAYEETAGAVLELSGHEDTVASLAFSTDGTLLASGGMDGRVLIWDAATGARVSTLEGPGEAVEWVRWHPRGAVVLAGAADCSVWMWNARTGDYMMSFAGHSGPVTCGGFTPDGKAVVTGSSGETPADVAVRVWDPKTGECRQVISGHAFHAQGLTALDVSKDSATLLTASEDGTARILNIASGRTVTNLTPSIRGAEHEEAPPGLEAAAFVTTLPGTAVTASLDGVLTVWDLGAAAPRLTCSHPDAITRIALHPTRPLVATACLDGIARCWDIRTGQSVATWHGHVAPIQDIVFAPDGQHVLTASEDGSARVYAL